MARQRDPKISLHDILQASRNCIEFTKGFDLSTFENDTKTTAAVLHQLMIIGEATKRLGKEFTDSNPVLPWKEIAGTRDVLIHHYEEADTEVVWKIITEQLYDVIMAIEKLIQEN